MAETLSNQGTDKVEATERENVADQMTPALSFQPNDGLVLDVEGGSGGIPVQAELYDSNGDLLPLDTEVTMEYEAPHMDKPQTASTKLANIQVYRTLDLKDQQNADYRDRTRIPLKSGVRKVEVRDIDEFHISINSSEVVDWSQSRLYIDKDHTTVRSED